MTDLSALYREHERTLAFAARLDGFTWREAARLEWDPFTVGEERAIRDALQDERNAARRAEWDRKARWSTAP